MHIGKDASAIARTNACILLGHPPKYPAIEFEDKQEWQRGCPCGHRDWI